MGQIYFIQLANLNIWPGGTGRRTTDPAAHGRLIHQSIGSLFACFCVLTACRWLLSAPMLTLCLFSSDLIKAETGKRRNITFLIFG